MKLRSLSELQDFLDRERSWRIREIADLKRVIDSSARLRQSAVLRAGITLLYAHWEGFVKNTAEGYVNYVSNQRLQYEELASNFIVFGAKQHIEHLKETNNARVNIEAVEFFRTKMSDRAYLSSLSPIKTEANLNSSVFENIVVSIGLDPSRYQSRYNLIDYSLLKRRNEIAHGEYLDIDADNVRHLADEVVTLLSWVKTDVENAASLGSYLHA